ncbi:MAG TPA: Rieske 2Fe-2S domain-containing protein [Chloroflexota bacterium]|nr:Rieske 2Fe-2S domain-containing protein [Chloroflexota bacterium]
MLTEQENSELTSTRKGTPMGELLRRYWHPIAASSQLPAHGTLPVRILGENLVLYRDRSGKLGLVAERCPHRGAGMIYGVPEHTGLRCAYHGWCFDASGRCIEQPYEQTEDPDSTFKDRVVINAYPVEELADLIFAYLGPEPAPLVPRWDLFTKLDAPREIGMAVLPCNWLQIVENALDPVHVEWLHQHFNNYVFERTGRADDQKRRQKHQKIGFDVFEYGIIKRRVLEGDTEEHERWATGHPLVFPMMLKSGSAAHPTYQMRTPIDDHTTLHIWYNAHYGAEGDLPVASNGHVPVYEVPVPTLTPKGEPEWPLVDNNSGQDIVMWYTQGAIANRSEEHLGLSDRGIILYRKLLRENLERVQRGEDPMNVFRDPARNVCLDLPVERAKFGPGTFKAGEHRAGGATKYSPLLRAAENAAANVSP